MASKFTPSGKDILQKLIELYAEQEGVTIQYVIETKGGNKQ